MLFFSPSDQAEPVNVKYSQAPSLATLINPWRVVTNVWQHRELAWQFTRREIQLRHKGSRLGAVWALVTPLSMLTLYFFVFGLIYKMRFGVIANETHYDFALALFLGLSLFHVFSEALGWAPAVITSNPNFVKKVVFPLEILPLAKLGDSAFHLMVSLALIVVGSVFSSPGLTVNVLWLPVLVLPMLMLGLGVAWALAAIGVFFRDISQMTAFVTTATLFSSAIFFPTSRLTPPWDILRYNPILQIVDLARHVVLWHEPMSWTRLGYVYGVALIVVMVGHALFTLLRRSFAEVI